ncbi:hypothetical protein [Rubritalea marina]|uniref:hypothetical protein n=1 Tax=Rubritalea marina TaxID=361055 RepID=UPI00035EEFB6|nr:hypothetical protein [Rubritalea marina]
MKTYQDLAKLLQQRLDVIGDEKLRTESPEEQLKQLQQVSEAIDTWKAQHLKSCPKQLQHYLVQYSLVKALDFLRDEGLL